MKADSYTSSKLLKELAYDKFIYRHKSNIKVVKILFSEKDRIIQKKCVEELNKAINGAEIISLGKIGHTSVVENYDKFKTEIINILEE